MIFTIISLVIGFRGTLEVFTIFGERLRSWAHYSPFYFVRQRPTVPAGVAARDQRAREVARARMPDLLNTTVGRSGSRSRRRGKVGKDCETGRGPYSIRSVVEYRATLTNTSARSPVAKRSRIHLQKRRKSCRK